MITRFKHFLQEYKFAFLTGALIGTSYSPFPPWAILFCFLPLWVYWFQNKEHLKKILISGWLASFTLTLIGFYWISYVAHEHGELPWWLALLVMLLFAAIASYFIPLSGMVWYLLTKKLKPTPVYNVLFLTLITLLCERFYWTLFTWNFGYPYLASGWPIYQLADTIGFTGLSLLTILFNGVFLFAYTQYKRQQNFKFTIAFALILFAALNLLGIYKAQHLPAPDKTVRVMPVQANIGNAMKLLAQRQFHNHKEILDRYIQLTQEGLEKNNDVDFVIWPETAIPFRLTQQLRSYGYEGYISRFLKSENIQLLAGSYHLNEKNMRTANAFYSFSKEGQVLSPPYKKTHLLAFGEYFPGYDSLPFMKAIADRLNIGSFDQGSGPMVMDTGHMIVGPQICYESLFPDFSTALARNGAQIFINVTNDSWYGPTSEPFQNYYMTMARGIEHRRPVIRSTNTGFTSVMLADGTFLTRSPLFKPWSHVYDVQYLEKPTRTFYQQSPNLLTYLAIGVFLTLLIQSIIRRK